MKERGLKKIIVGTVVSNKMDKTVVVEIKQRIKHEKYQKFINKTTKFKAHDENNECGIGDLVSIVESRPISKDKRWKVKNIEQKAL